MSSALEHCEICPRRCGINRLAGQKGFCGVGQYPRLARAALHHWEEPCISGSRGSGTVFFSRCNLRCLFCQNYDISQRGFGKDVTTERLAQIFLELQGKGAHNVNLVSPTPYLPLIVEALDMASARGLRIPIVYNTNAYENPELLQLLKGRITIFLPDLKYCDDALALRYSSAPNYFDVATKAICTMVDIAGKPTFSEDGIMTAGVIVRHLVLPGHVDDSIRVLRWIADELKGSVLVSLMSQYVPMYRASEYPDLSRRLSREEYDKVLDSLYSLNLEDGYVQELDSADSSFTPPFDLEGV